MPIQTHRVQHDSGRVPRKPPMGTRPQTRPSREERTGNQTAPQCHICASAGGFVPNVIPINSLSWMKCGSMDMGLKKNFAILPVL
mmetsp:Transcript_50540/g.97708  ORF Transcript_50540/g.97708 Transcript_50540/m.97708 type:complete len:85 (-) Transcript_50540:872-1126(-)